MFDDDLEAAIRQLYESRMISTREEFFRFEDAIVQLAGVADYRIVRRLYPVFDDGTHEEEVMWGLLHLVEHLGGEGALVELAHATPGMLARATEWAKLFHMRMLNHAPSRALYASVLSTIDLSTREVIVALLREIVEENPDRFQAHAEELIAQ
jgi:Immunity protein 30